MLLHSNTTEINMLYIHCFRLLSIMNTNTHKQTIYSRYIHHTLLHGGSIPPTSTNIKYFTLSVEYFIFVEVGISQSKLTYVGIERKTGLQNYSSKIGRRIFEE